MGKPNAASGSAATVSKFLWLVVLIPILGVSAYSLFYVARHLGVPPWIAWSMSTCFDGVALLAAEYSLRYAQAGLSGSGPRAVVRCFAALAAYIQTLHARIGHEPPGSWALWASLPVAAVLVYEIHIRWERRKALARAGVSYPAPLPAFGLTTWLLFPYPALKSLREIVSRRREAIVAEARSRPALGLTLSDKEVTAAATVAKRTVTRALPAKASVSNVRPIGSVNPHTPKREIRAWAKEQKYDISDRARIPGWIEQRYWAAHPDLATEEVAR